MRESRTINTVQTPIIPVIGEWTRNTPGTLSMGQGMVGYPPPEAAIQAIHAFGSKSEHHYYGPASGYQPLLEIIERKLLTENDIDISLGYRVMVTTGSNMAFLNVLLSITDPGDEIILPMPYYFNQEMAVRMVNCKPVVVPTDSQFHLQIELLREAINEKTRAIVTVSPNNPSGAVYTEVSLRAVNQLCRDYGLYHISDEAYEYFTYDEIQHFSPGSISGAEVYTISLYSLSKAYGFAGWRIGYMVIPDCLTASLLKVQDTNLICPPIITQFAALGALTAGSFYCKYNLHQLFTVRNKIIEHLLSIPDICKVTPNEGAFYLLVKLVTDKNDLAVVKSLIEDFKVAVIPGSAFGLLEGCYLRLSYGMLNADVAEIAIQRLIAGLVRICG